MEVGLWNGKNVLSQCWDQARDCQLPVHILHDKENITDIHTRVAGITTKAASRYKTESSQC